MNNNNKILTKFKPIKIIGKGSQGLILQTHNDNYTIKIYQKSFLKAIEFLKIINYIQSYKNLPKTIYISYLFTKSKNNYNRYIKTNKLPDYFSYKNNYNLELLANQYKMNNKLFEIMKTYNHTLNIFINTIKNNSSKNNILLSLFQQGLLTIIWLFMNKSIIHNDISDDNFFIEPTDDQYIIFEFNSIQYKIKLYGYYLVMADFGYAKSIEFHFSKKNEKQPNAFLLYEYNPLIDIENFIQLFKKFNINLNINIFESKLMIQCQNKLKQVIRTFNKNDSSFRFIVNEYKECYFKLLQIQILSKLNL